ncbi:hypothetical protein Taro_050936 [Colocasia esculenta]|uniref:Uncharacterized protein n=1 Tax=Colocasia esculenta TaxID=4460 RepID=A0A843XEN6_COLES|nr:hypothetical protein [Colocasia esculenta]
MQATDLKIEHRGSCTEEAIELKRRGRSEGKWKRKPVQEQKHKVQHLWRNSRSEYSVFRLHSPKGIGQNRRTGHVKPECPDVQKKFQPKWKKNKPKAMIETWSEEEDDEDEENSEDDENESIICLMARDSSNDSIVRHYQTAQQASEEKVTVRSTLLDRSRSRRKAAEEEEGIVQATDLKTEHRGSCTEEAAELKRRGRSEGGWKRKAMQEQKHKITVSPAVHLLRAASQLQRPFYGLRHGGRRDGGGDLQCRQEGPSGTKR